MRRVGVTGFGVVSPLGIGRDAFWRSLREGRIGIDRIRRFDAGTFEVQLAGEVNEPLALPEASARAAENDPKVGFAFAACAEALSCSGMGALPPGAVLHLGVSLEYFDLARAVCDGTPDFRRVAERSLAGDGPPIKMPLDTAAGIICRTFGRPARSLTNCSACAAGAQAIGHGFRIVRAGDCDAAVCGGFDSMINPLGIGGFQLLGALTTDTELGARACRPFDASRSGTVLGEGAAVFVLEPVEKARAEGKRILAEICGYGSTLDAHSLSAPDPEGDGAARAMRAALDDAGVVPEDIGHINAHGTGTRLNDEVEAAAVRRVFDGCWEHIPVSSIKSMTGHLIAAAGAVEAGACLMALAESVMPPNPTLQAVGQGCELNHVGAEAEPFDGEFVLSNSFGFGGQNAVLVMRKSDA
jgi:3-oxoacyl-[acyl-carrier-protein] synthase II